MNPDLARRAERYAHNPAHQRPLRPFVRFIHDAFEYTETLRED